MAFKYLSWLLYPLFGCYAVYSVLYQEHKGWYSFVLGMLYGFLLTFGESRVVIVQKWDCKYFCLFFWFWKILVFYAVMIKSLNISCTVQDK